MERKGGSIVVKVNREFVNTSHLANMSHYRCGQVIPTNAEFVVCEWDKTDAEIIKLLSGVVRHIQLSVRDIDAILNNIFNLCSGSWYERQRIYTLVYVESLMNQGLVEVEWYDWL